MNYIVVIILLLVVAMVVGPVAMLRPSPAQKKRDALRLRARQLGVAVHLRLPPSAATATEKASHMAAYCIHHKGVGCWQLVRASFAHEIHLNEWWQFQAAKPGQAVRNFLSQTIDELPRGVVAVTAQGQEVAVYWKEWGEAGNVDQLTGFLQKLAQVASVSEGSPDT
ncbi:hypothetical protein QWI17_11160 [Gilvimarinus sp. SDUM040013]|uniref:Preprotein translocase subunit YajC n=1 Tax=Gilvimarinus gilvus TaxID=3058038 RepID=A0ABU4S1D5_9GAMM|nr:hypothetical protein [Gilvimarinus sp. SDUM040013]MDO3386397.1 hypothetical protein [Gilvimarinus sp. SDUM040013]MDX6849663.1 hypothetical protein [Gilvimarinus sp. SDUM040013]